MLISDSSREDYMELIRLEKEAEKTYEDLFDAAYNCLFNGNLDEYRDLCVKQNVAFARLQDCRNHRRFIAMVILDEMLSQEK